MNRKGWRISSLFDSVLVVPYLQQSLIECLEMNFFSKNFIWNVKNVESQNSGLVSNLESFLSYKEK